MARIIDSIVVVNVPGFYSGPAQVIGRLPIPYSTTIAAYKVEIPGHDEAVLVYPREIVDDRRVVALPPRAFVDRSEVSPPCA